MLQNLHRTKMATVAFMFLIYFLVVPSLSFRVPGRCAIGWVEYKDQCFLFQEESILGKDEVDAICASMGASVLSIPSEEQDNFLNDYLINFEESQKWWTSGVRRVIDEEKTRLWTWSTVGNGLTGFHFKKFDSQEAELQQQQDQSNVKKCLKYQLRSNDRENRLLDSYIWVPSACDEKASAICVKPACPKDWYAISSKKCIKLENDRKLFDEQWASCKMEEKGNLLYLNSTFEFRQLEGILREQYAEKESTWRIMGGDYLGFDAQQFKSYYPNRYHYNSRTRSPGPPCISDTQCRAKTSTFAAWLPGEPDFFTLPRISRSSSWLPSFSVTNAPDANWTSATGYHFGVQDSLRKTPMKSICQKLSGP